MHADTPIRAATISPRFYIDTRLTDISPLPRVIPGKFLGNHEMMKFRSTLLRMEERINEINPEEEGEERPLRVISKRLLFYERKYCRSFFTYFSVLFCKKIKIRFAIFFNRWLINPFSKIRIPQCPQLLSILERSKREKDDPIESFIFSVDCTAN